MPQIQSFAALRYSPAAGDPGQLIAPPYDVLAGSRLDALRQNPHNIVHLTLPTGTPPESYSHAAELFNNWRNDGTLASDPVPALYPYRQHFIHPVTHQLATRTGIMAAVRLHEYSERIILPHERTLSGPRADRLELMRATHAQLEPILGAARDASGAIQSEIDRAMSEDAPILDTVDSDGTRHELWAITDPARIEALRDAFRNEQIVLIDGHHRYETSLAYRNELGTSGNDPEDFILMNVATVRDPGLVILPTYRILKGVPNFSLEGLMARLSPMCLTVPVMNMEQGLQMLETMANTPSYLFYTPLQQAIVTFPDGAAFEGHLGSVVPPVLRSLDVTILHDLIFDQMLGITREAQEAQTYINYAKSVEDAMIAAADPETQLVVFMNPTRLEQVFDVASAGLVLPQKSTYFVPKLASGTLMRALEG